jgi:hypothetical protein
MAKGFAGASFARPYIAQGAIEPINTTSVFLILADEMIVSVYIVNIDYPR